MDIEITDKQLGKAFKVCREQRIKSLDRAAIEIGMCASSLNKRETGVYSIKLSELILLGKVVGVHPSTLLWEIIEECDRGFWDDVAVKLNCTPGIAKRRLAEEAKRRNIEVWQLWMKIEKRQVSL